MSLSRPNVAIRPGAGGHLMGAPSPEMLRRQRHDAPPPGPLFEDALTYGEPTFALAVSHCPWIEERAAIMAHCRETFLQVHPWRGPYREVTEREPNWAWSRRMWGWGAAQPVTHGVYLQDDLFVHPDFWRIVRAMVRAAPNRVIALLSNHPLAPRAYAEGARFLRCGETLGSGYIVPTVLMGAFLERRDRLPLHLQRETEDFQLTRWLVETGRRALHPLPGIIDTRPGVETTDPTKEYPCRRSYLPWTDERVAGLDLTSEVCWRTGVEPPDYGPTVLNDNRLPHGPFASEEVLKLA